MSSDFANTYPFFNKFLLEEVYVDEEKEIDNLWYSMNRYSEDEIVVVFTDRSCNFTPISEINGWPLSNNRVLYFFNPYSANNQLERYYQSKNDN